MSGTVRVTSGDSHSKSGDLELGTGNLDPLGRGGSHGTGTSGQIFLKTSPVANGSSGNVRIETGDSMKESSGSVMIETVSEQLLIVLFIV